MSMQIWPDSAARIVRVIAQALFPNGLISQSVFIAQEIQGGIRIRVA
jgi:hypothetical protein